MSFPCTLCGACCRSIEGISFLEEYNDAGTCKKMMDNQCSIYDDRPLLCRVDESYQEIFSEYMTLTEYYIENAKACNELQEKLNIDKSFRVVIEVHQNK